jgi:hypothetical protein
VAEQFALGKQLLVYLQAGYQSDLGIIDNLFHRGKYRAVIIKRTLQLYVILTESIKPKKGFRAKSSFHLNPFEKVLK